MNTFEKLIRQIITTLELNEHFKGVTISAEKTTSLSRNVGIFHIEEMVHFQIPGHYEENIPLLVLVLLHELGHLMGSDFNPQLEKLHAVAEKLNLPEKHLLGRAVDFVTNYSLDALFEEMSADAFAVMYAHKLNVDPNLLLDLLTSLQKEGWKNSHKHIPIRIIENIHFRLRKIWIRRLLRKSLFSFLRLDG
jgi:hypothetical protein